VSDEIEIVSDGEGVAFFGEPREVEKFLNAAGIASKEISVRTTGGTVLSAGSAAAQAGSQLAANSGRWVKLTEDSAKALKLGKAMSGSSGGVSRAIATTSKGKVTKILEFVKPGSVGSVLTNPAMLAGAAGIMAQLAMQQTMEEITQYLAVIDEKVDDVLRAQNDAAISPMIGVGWLIDEAMSTRERVGRVPDETWSQLTGAAQTIATTQAYALRQLDALAEKLEKKGKVGELAKVSHEAEATIEEWLAVLARCFQLQDGLAILELDRVMHSSPDELERHREAIQAGRRNRRNLIASATGRLLERIDNAAAKANEQALLHPRRVSAIVKSGNEVGRGVTDFHARLGIQQDRDALEAKRWLDAVSDARVSIAQTVEAGVTAATRVGSTAFTTVRTSTESIPQRVAQRLHRRNSSPQIDEGDRT